VQTGSISYRVADTLKQYPPFQSMEEADLLALTARGRVKFHEADEYILWENAAHGPYVFFIQQGTVSLWETTPEGEQLRDIRGVGDMLGLTRYNGSETSGYSAKAASEVVIYALPATDFGACVEKYPNAKRYVAAHMAVTPDYQPQDHRKGAHEIFLYDAIPRREPAVCSTEDSVAEAARRMGAAGSRAIAVVQDGAGLTGVVGGDAILQALGTPGFLPSQPVSNLIQALPCVLPSDATVSQSVVAMAEAGANIAAITEGGLPTGKLHGLITSADLTTAFGDQPGIILREISIAGSVEALRVLQQRARAFVLTQLDSPSAVDWLARFTFLADVAVLKRIARLFPPPAGGYCWCLYGGAGRGESLPPAQQRAAIILRDPSMHAFFVGWYRVVQQALRDCDYIARPAHYDDLFSVAGIEEWKHRFSGWIEDPVANPVHHALPLFDLRPAMGDFALYRDLENTVNAAIGPESNFVRLLAHDCLSSLPPLTFYRDAVIEESGEQTTVFDLKKRALRPLVDVGRVFATAAGHALGGSTLERFQWARAMLPAQESIFREAADTLRVVLALQARAGIRQHSSGSDLPPAMLSHHDRQILKIGFRSLHRLLEFTADGSWLEGV